MTEKKENTTAMIIASQNQDYVDEGLAEYQDQIHKLQSKSCIGYNKKSACLRLLVCVLCQILNFRFTFSHE